MKYLASLTLITLLNTPNTQGRQCRRLFESPDKTYAVTYPCKWQLLDSQHFDVLNFLPAERVKGVTIKKNGAEINLTVSPSAIESVDAWIAADNKNGVLLDRIEMSAPGAMRSADKAITKTLTRSEVGPGVYFIYTSYYLRLGSKFFRVTLTNWENDPNQKVFQAVALEIAQSIRQE